ncbi:MAG: hypothetical protein AAFQ66_10965 [Pseudomonadota bacterium]
MFSMTISSSMSLGLFWRCVFQTYFWFTLRLTLGGIFADDRMPDKLFPQGKASGKKPPKTKGLIGRFAWKLENGGHSGDKKWPPRNSGD